MSTYKFTTIDTLNGTLQPSSHADPTYTTSTIFGRRSRKITTLSPTEDQCAIHWREKQFEINGLVRDLAAIKSKPGEPFNSIREWRWAGPRYSVQHQDGRWTATSSSGTIAATFTPPRKHLFSADEPGVLVLAQGITETNIAFLILVMLYSEVRRQERKKRNHAAGGGSGIVG